MTSAVNAALSMFQLTVPTLASYSRDESVKLDDWLADAQMATQLSAVNQSEAVAWVVDCLQDAARQVWHNAAFPGSTH